MSHRYELSAENKGAADVALDFPKLRLKKGEAARLALFSIVEGADGKKSFSIPAPEGGYFWSIRKPDGSFGGGFECIAPEDVKRADEFDGEACPHCAAVLDGAPEDIIEPRRRRFVMHVVRYLTAPGKSTLLKPYSVEALSWRFTDRYFNALVEENEKWTSGQTPGLLAHDLTLYCENENFQTYKVSVEPEAAWRSDKDLMALVVGTYQAAVEMAPSLRRQLGVTLTKEQMQTRIDEALRRVAATPAAPTVDPSMIEGLADELFGSAPAAAPVAEQASLDDLSGSTEAASVAAPAETQEAEATEAAPAPTAGEAAEELDFDSFFNS